MSYAKKIFVFAAALSLMACGGHKIIPDKELAQIFHDIYLVDAYVSQNGMAVDTLNIYEPVFASYGYTTEDFQYTIGNFSKRKSASLSNDVLEPAIENLHRESRWYTRRIEIRDTIILIAKTKFAEQIYSDSLIRVRRIADTARLRITIEDIRPGTYKIEYGYLVDSLDRNLSLRTSAYLVDAAGNPSRVASQRLERERHNKVESTLIADSTHHRIVLSLNGYPKGLTTPNFTIDSLRVTYYLPDKIAVDKLSRSIYRWDTLDSLLIPLPRSHETPLFAPLIDTARTRVR